MAKVTTIEIDGAKYPVDCNENGQFGTYAEGDWLKAPSLDLLKKRNYWRFPNGSERT